jgi:NitT/TauT family transport system ATP-binding protein
MTLKISDLSVSYNGRVVLDKIHLEVKEREFVAIVGSSGCGKTTLINAISGFIPYEGRIDVPGRVGVVFQNHAVFPWMTVEKNISFGLRGNKTVQHYLNMTGLSGKSESYPFELSGGQIQRVAVARTLAADPDLILMDEPFGALDTYTRESMQQWLLRVWVAHTKTILFVTHSIDEAIFLADRILLLSDGKISEEFKVGLNRPRTDETKFGKPFIGLKKQVTASIAAAKPIESQI